MKKKLIFSITFSLVLFCGMKAQNDDPVVMTIAGQPVLRSEFEYALNKNSKGSLVKDPKAIEDYVNLFISYKLKVQAAVDAHLDTLSSFRNEFRQYRNAQLRPYFQDNDYEDSVAKEVYASIKKSVGDSDILLLSHILIAIPQKASASVQKEAKEKIDSIYNALKYGADFGEMAKKFSNDFISAGKGGQLPWLGPKSSLPEFEKVAYSMKPGDICVPFLSSAGYHIILMKDRKKLEPYAEKKAEIMKLLKNRGLENQAMEHSIKKMMAESGTLTRENVLEKVCNEAEKNNANLKNLIKEYHDGLLLYEVCNRFVWMKAAEDKKGLEKFFNKNKKNYAWSEPHFKGFYINGHHKSQVDAATNFLSKYKSSVGIEEMKKKLPKDSIKLVFAIFRVYKAGDNAYVDAKEFGKPEPKRNKVFPYYGVTGKIINKPEDYRDVQAKVTSDYQDFKEKEWVESLRKHYKYTVDKSVLSTVNNH